MKKFLSLVIALLLIVSLSATTVVAFADEAEATFKVTYNAGDQGEGTAPEEKSYKQGAEVTLAAKTAFKVKKGYEFAGWKVSGNDTVYKAGDKFTMPANDVTVTAVWQEAHKVEIVASKLNDFLKEDIAKLKFEMGDVKFGAKLMETAANVKEAFSGIKYVDEDTDTEKKADNDKIYIEYCRPSESPKGQATWQNKAKITDEIRISSSGWYLFRIVVKDSTDTNVLATSEPFCRYAEDTRRPVVALSSTMKTKVANGLVATKSYDIPTSGLTSGSTDEMSSTTVNFKIYKFVNGAWTTEPIYDSKTKEIAKGYEKFVSSSGAITPSNDDISSDPVYKVVYSVTDAYGFSGVENKDNWANYDASLEFNPEMLLKVVPAETEKKSPVNVWEIVLFCIAGAAAIGIVVLLFIKPKQPAPAREAAAGKDAPSEQEEAKKD